MRAAHKPMGHGNPMGVGKPQFMNPQEVPPDESEVTEADLMAEEEEQPTPDRDEVRSEAEAIAATLDPNSIQINWGDDAPVKLGRNGPTTERRTDYTEWSPRPRSI